MFAHDFLRFFYSLPKVLTSGCQPYTLKRFQQGLVPWNLGPHFTAFAELAVDNCLPFIVSLRCMLLLYPLLTSSSSWRANCPGRGRGY